jgi:Lhr-like helicase
VRVAVPDPVNWVGLSATVRPGEPVAARVMGPGNEFEAVTVTVDEVDPPVRIVTPGGALMLKAGAGCAR